MNPQSLTSEQEQAISKLIVHAEWLALTERRGEEDWLLINSLQAIRALRERLDFVEGENEDWKTLDATGVKEADFMKGDLSKLKQALTALTTENRVLRVKLEGSNEQLLSWGKAQSVEQAKLAAQEARIKELEEVLRKLSCLGNGDQVGNSEGNIIAFRALHPSAASTAAQEPKIGD